MNRVPPSFSLSEESGQSTIEFLFTMTIALGILFSFFKMAIVYTNGYLVHYVVFQASRAYMVGEGHSGQESASDLIASDRARSLFDSYNLPGIVHNFQSPLQIESPDDHRDSETNLYIGVRTRYEENLMIPLSTAKIPLEMISESYLGREPTRAECFHQVCQAMRDVGSGAGCKIHSTVDDNGC